MRKQFQRFGQIARENIMRGEKSDELTENLVEVEKKVEGIRNGCHVTAKKLLSTVVGSGSTAEKHQKRIPYHVLGSHMVEASKSLEESSLFATALDKVGSTQLDIAGQLAHYEICMSSEVIAELNSMVEEGMKKIDKAKKKLSSARLDMDSARNRLQSMEKMTEKATKEFNLGKLEAARSDCDEASHKFEVCQEAYATAMFNFISREREFAEKLKQLVMLQMAFHKQALVSLESTLPSLNKKMDESQDRPVFGTALEDHLRVSKQTVAVVIQDCAQALRESWMDTDGLFRIAASSAKVKFLKSSFDAGQRDLSEQDPHTIAGCLKMYLRELPEPLLTHHLYSEWMQAAGIADPKERLTALWSVKEKLPKPNLENFACLIEFLKEFSQYSESTRMGVSNIAIVIGPNLLWPKEEDSDASGLVTETALRTRICEAFIEHCNWFFPASLDNSNTSGSNKTTSPTAGSDGTTATSNNDPSTLATERPNVFSEFRPPPTKPRPVPVPKPTPTPVTDASAAPISSPSPVPVPAPITLPGGGGGEQSPKPIPRTKLHSNSSCGSSSGSGSMIGGGGGVLESVSSSAAPVLHSSPKPALKPKPKPAPSAPTAAVAPVPPKRTLNLGGGGGGEGVVGDFARTPSDSDITSLDSFTYAGSEQGEPSERTGTTGPESVSVTPRSRVDSPECGQRVSSSIGPVPPTRRKHKTSAPGGRGGGTGGAGGTPHRPAPPPPFSVSGRKNNRVPPSPPAPRDNEEISAL